VIARIRQYAMIGMAVSSYVETKNKEEG